LDKRAEAYLEKGDCDNAAADYTKIIELDPDRASFYASSYIEHINEYGKKSVEEKNYDAAIGWFIVLIKLEPDTLSHYEDRIDAYFKKGDMGSVNKECPRLIELYTQRTNNNPDAFYYYLHRAKMHAYTKNKTRAYADIDRARQIASSSETMPAVDTLRWVLFGEDAFQEIMDILNKY
jgi:tetratricopeptide (TPR) repeat protein